MYVCMYVNITFLPISCGQHRNKKHLSYQTLRLEEKAPCWFCFCCFYLRDFCPRTVDIFIKVDQHSDGTDASSIVFLVIRHLETEFVRSCVIPICDWFILIWSQGPVPTNSSHEAILRTSRRNLSQKFKPD